MDPTEYSYKRDGYMACSRVNVRMELGWLEAGEFVDREDIGN